MIKYIIFIITLLYTGSIFAIDIELFSDEENYNIDDLINLVVKINDSEDSENQENIWDYSLDITWIDNFEIVSQSRRSNIKIVNNERTEELFLQFSLVARESWDYTIGPFTIWSESSDNEFTSNSINLSITGERLMVNPVLRDEINNLNPLDDEFEDEDFSDIDLLWNDDKNKLDEAIYWVDWSEMKDIYWIKPNLKWSLVSKQSLIYLFIAIIILLLYILLKKAIYINNTKLKPAKKIKPKKPNYKKLILNLEKDINLSKDKFYLNIWDILRLYLDYKFNRDFSKKTLKEIELELDDDEIINIYRDIYYPEYNNLWDTKDYRLDLITRLKKLVL